MRNWSCCTCCRRSMRCSANTSPPDSIRQQCVSCAFWLKRSAQVTHVAWKSMLASRTVIPRSRFSLPPLNLAPISLCWGPHTVPCSTASPTIAPSTACWRMRAVRCSRFATKKRNLIRFHWRATRFPSRHAEHQPCFAAKPGTLARVENENEDGLLPSHRHHSTQEREELRKKSLRGEPFELIGLGDGHGSALDHDPLVASKLVQQARYRLTRSARHVGDLLMRERHGEADFGLASRCGFAPVQQQPRQPSRSGPRECQPLGIVKHREVFARQRLRRMHAGYPVTSQKVDELLLANGLHLAGF